MVQACKHYGVLLMTAYRKYFEPSTLFLKTLVRTGKLGRIELIQTGFTELFVPGKSPAWLLDRRLAGGGPLPDLGIYCVNTTRWLVNEDPFEVTAASWRHDSERFKDVEEGISFRLKFSSGLTVEGASSYAAAMSSFIHVYGTKGWASLTPAYDFNDPRQLTWQTGGRKMTKGFKVIDEFAPELDAFAKAIQGQSAIEPDGAQGHRDMLILRSIYEAADT
jgi:predicted dehydrogenase